MYVVSTVFLTIWNIKERGVRQENIRHKNSLVLCCVCGVNSVPNYLEYQRERSQAREDRKTYWYCVVYVVSTVFLSIWNIKERGVRQEKRRQKNSVAMCCVCDVNSVPNYLEYQRERSQAGEDIKTHWYWVVYVVSTVFLT